MTLKKSSQIPLSAKSKGILYMSIRGHYTVHQIPCVHDTALINRYSISKEDPCKEGTRGCDKGVSMCVAKYITSALSMSGFSVGDKNSSGEVVFC